MDAGRFYIVRHGVQGSKSDSDIVCTQKEKRGTCHTIMRARASGGGEGNSMLALVAAGISNGTNVQKYNM